MNGSVGIFVSHISEEAEVAAKLKEMLEMDFRGLVRVFTSTDIGSIHGGDFWLNSVQRAISDAGLFIVLCSKASTQRAWVQFELGLAWGTTVPILPVCHSTMTPKELPVPLNLRQSAEFGTEAGVRRIYESVAKAAGCKVVPLPDLPTRLLEIKSIEDRYRESPVEQFERYLDIIIPGKLHNDTIPEDARIESNQESFRLFGYTSGPRKWRDIVKAAGRIPDQRWLRQLQKCVSLASRDEDFPAIQAIYHTDRGSFQPQLSKREINSKGESRFHIHLVETVVAPLMEVPNDFGLLATLMRLGLRFRYEVIENHLKILRRVRDEQTLVKLLEQLRTAIDIIKTDALSRGAQNFDPDSIVDLFADERDQEEMQKIQEDWKQAESLLSQVRVTTEDIRAVLDCMDEINLAFMKLSTRRFHEMVQEKLSTRRRGLEAGRQTVRRRRVAARGSPGAGV